MKTFVLLGITVMAFFKTETLAAVVIEGDVQNGDSFSLIFTEPISFTMSGGAARFFYFRQWTPTNGLGTTVRGFPTQEFLEIAHLSDVQESSDLRATIPIQFTDNSNFKLREVSEHDSRLSFNPAIPVASGDVITILAQTLVFETNSDFNEGLSNSTFTGQLFFSNAFGQLVSSVETAVPVPEPATWLLGVVGCSFSLRIRTRSSN